MSTCFGVQERMEYLRRHGCHSMAYSTLQPGMNYYDVPGVGYLAYMQHWGQWFVLTDPVCAKEDWRTIASIAITEHPDICFVQISRSFAQVLSDMGFFVNSLGVENVIDTRDFPISWNTRRDLKRWLSRFDKEHVDIREGDGGIPSSEIRAVSEEWIRSKLKHHELAFMARPYSFAPEPDVRKFFASNQGTLLAYCSLDPSYSNGMVASYLVCHLRCRRNAPSGLLDYTVLRAIAVLKDCGVSFVHLGISPFYERDDSCFRNSWVTRLVFSSLYNYGNTVFSFKNLGFHKDRYKARKEQTYIATKRRNTVRTIYSLLKLVRCL